MNWSSAAGISRFSSRGERGAWTAMLRRISIGLEPGNGSRPVAAR